MYFESFRYVYRYCWLSVDLFIHFAIRYKEAQAVETPNVIGVGLKKQTGGGETPSSTIGIKRTSTEQGDGGSTNKRSRVLGGQVSDPL